MHKTHEFDNCLIAIFYDSSMPHLVDGPDELKELMNGSNFADNCIIEHGKGDKDDVYPTFPTEPGVYLATVEHWFEQGYSEGYRSDGESETTFQVSNARLVINAVMASEFKAEQQPVVGVLIPELAELMTGDALKSSLAHLEKDRRDDNCDDDPGDCK